MDTEVAVDSVRQPLLRGDEESCSFSWPNFRDEAKKQLKIAVPMIAMNMLQSSLALVTNIYVGHLGQISLAAVSVASSFYSIVALCFLAGIATALETLCGQSYGAGQYRLHGILLQRTVIILLFLSATFSVVFLFMNQILSTLGQDPSISAEAGEYSKWFIPVLFACAFLLPMVKFLQTQSIVIPLMLSFAFGLVVHVPLCWFLILKLGLGIKGAALSISISLWVITVLLLLYIKFSDACEKTRTPISMEALHDLKNFLKIAIPSTAMICCVLWCFDIVVFISGLLPNPKLQTSVISICMSISSFSYTIPSGLSAASSTRVSNELGAGHTNGALLVLRVTVCLSVTETIIRGTTLLLLKDVWGRAFSKDLQVIQYTATMVPILVLTSMINGIQGVLQGIATGCGLQRWGACINFGAYYVVGLPFAVIMGFAMHLGAKGLWLGILAGLLTQTILLVLITVCHDWKELAKTARKRVYESALPLGNSATTKDKSITSLH